MSQPVDHVGNKARRDLVTNPAWFEMLGKLKEVERREIAGLQAVATGAELAGINTQAGIVQGVQRCLLRLDNFQKDILDDASQKQVA